MHFCGCRRETGFSAAPSIGKKIMPGTPPPRQGRKNRFLSLTERKELATLLISETSWGTGVPKLAIGAMARAAEKFRVSREAISRFWRDMRRRYATDGILSGSPTRLRTGRRSLYYNTEVAMAVEALPFEQRRSQFNKMVQSPTLPRMIRSSSSA